MSAAATQEAAATEAGDDGRDVYRSEIATTQCGGDAPRRSRPSAAILAQAAWERGFYEAKSASRVRGRRFQQPNWGVWERRFSNFTPIVDFIHALSYVFQAAMAGRSFAVGWEAYTDWIHALWAGQVERVIAGLTQRQVDLGVPTAEETETSPKMRVAEALTYLQNQKERMRYGEYRKQGLPITSSHIESTIKQINQRVKGTEKFWSSMKPKRSCNCAPTHSAKRRRSAPSGNDDKKRQRDSDATKSQGNYRPCRTPAERLPLL